MSDCSRPATCKMVYHDDYEASEELEPLKSVTFHESGNVKMYTGKSSLPVNNKRDGYYELKYRYYAPDGHKSTQLSHDELVDSIMEWQEALKVKPDDIGGFCGSMNNGGNWEGYIQMWTNDGDWPVCSTFPDSAHDEL